MPSIGWIDIVSAKYGASAYEDMAKSALSKKFDLELVDVKTKHFKRGYFRAPEILFNLINLKGKKDLWIRGFYPMMTLPFNRTKGKNLVIIHHIDFSQSSGFAKIIDFIIENIARLSIKKADFIVTVSEYWKQYFLDRGFKNVYKIYNSFKLDDFNISDEEAELFKKKYNLSDKPIVYLGNCQKDKGVIESYDALKYLDVHLVTSGEPFCQLPALNLKVEYRDYLRLLKSSSVVLSMSKVNEGWGRTCHEAMLLKRPVIGSGRGGMRELLEGGGQIVCQDFSSLKKNVEHLLTNAKERTERGE
ncbi:MAG: glycosyltransferase family 4 protein [bacterium]|nr:glycosyltransferase family 4 protein [bacterium]